jgi:hypothetical protein
MKKLIVESHETNVSRYSLELNSENFKKIQKWLALRSDYLGPLEINSVGELSELLDSDAGVVSALHSALAGEIGIECNFENVNLDDTSYYANII